MVVLIMYLTDGCVGSNEDAQSQIESEADEADHGCAEQLDFEDFGQGYTGGWGLQASQDVTFGSPFLRLHKQQSQVFKDVAVPFDADIVTVEFELFEIDSWEQDDRLKVAHLQRLLSCSFSNTCYSQYGPFFSLDNSPRYPWTERPLILALSAKQRLLIRPAKWQIIFQGALVVLFGTGTAQPKARTLALMKDLRTRSMR